MSKIILTHEVTGLGEPGDVIEVKAGYARNYLIPRNLATPWTRGFEKQVDSIRKGRKSREVASLEDAKALKQSLENASVVVPSRAGENGRLFGAVTSAEIATAVKESTGRDIDRRKVEVQAPIRAIGTHTAAVRLHPEVSATLTIEVVPAR